MENKELIEQIKNANKKADETIFLLKQLTTLLQKKSNKSNPSINLNYQKSIFLCECNNIEEVESLNLPEARVEATVYDRHTDNFLYRIRRTYLIRNHKTHIFSESKLQEPEPKNINELKNKFLVYTY